MSLTNNMIDIDFQRNFDENILENMLDEFSENDSQYNLFQTDNLFTLLIVDANRIRTILDHVVEKFDYKIREGLSKIAVSLNEDDVLLSLLGSHCIFTR